jgi:hypothetical protein
MNWIFVLISFLMPIVQPVVQQGVQNVQVKIQQRQQAQQPHVVYHNGEWWKYEGGQWYVWRAR